MITMANEQKPNDRVRTEMHRGYLPYASQAAAILTMETGERVHNWMAVSIALKEWVELKQAEFSEVT